MIFLVGLITSVTQIWFLLFAVFLSAIGIGIGASAYLSSGSEELWHFEASVALQKAESRRERVTFEKRL